MTKTNSTKSKASTTKKSATKKPTKSYGHYDAPKVPASIAPWNKKTPNDGGVY